MQLDTVTAEIRPRSGWEAADLGLALTRRHLGAIMKLWCLFVLPIMILVAAICWQSFPAIGVLIIWFLKPIYDRIPLFYLSRALFGEHVSVKATAKAYPTMWFRRFFWRLILARFSPHRSFVMPLEELEGLKGKQFSKRADLLGRYGASTSTSVLGVFGLLEVLSVVALFFLYIMFLPEVKTINFEAWFAEMGAMQSGEGLPKGISRILLVLYIITVTLLEPFYVGSGFGLYINSRTITEGWDIELAFKRLKERLVNKSLVKTAVFFLLACLFWNSPAKAESADVSTHQEQNEILPAQERIQGILESEDFKVHDLTIKVPEENNWKGLDWNFGDVAWMGELIYGLLIFAGVALLTFLIIQIIKNLSRAQFRPLEIEKPQLPKVTTVSGMEITQESLPKNILQVARDAWQKGDSRNALSLLYRGALASLIDKDQIPIEEGDTEADCLRHARQHSVAELLYFTQLTNTWLLQAYDHNAPTESQWQSLYDTWPFQAQQKGAAQ